MATDFFQLDEDEEKQNQLAPQGMVQLGPESATEPAQGRTNANSGTGGTSSGAYTNLQSYLDANKAENFGGKVAGQIQGTVDEANRAQETAGSGFRQEVDKGAVSENPDLVGQVNTDPMGLVKDQGKFSEFLRQRDAQYGGPNDLVDRPELFSSVDTATRKATEQSESSKSEGGRKALLDQLYGSGAGRNDYSSGQKKLDNLLIQNDPTSREAFQKVQGAASQTAAAVPDLKTALSGYAGQRKAETQKTRAGARSALGIDEAGNYTPGAGAIGGLNKDIDTAFEGRKTKQQTESDSIRQALGGRDISGLSADLRAALSGVAPGQLYGVDPARYLSVAPNLSRETATSPEQHARMAALSQLAGVDNTFTREDLAGQMDDEALYGYDAPGLQRDIQGGKQRFDYEVQQMNAPVQVPGFVFGDADVADPRTPSQQLSLEDAVAKAGPRYQQLAAMPAGDRTAAENDFIRQYQQWFARKGQLDEFRASSARDVLRG